MTTPPPHFTTYNPCSRQQKIKVADGTLAATTGQGTINLTPSLTLKSILHVPKLSVSLLSFHQITKDLNCSVKFFPSYCVFQYRITGRMIENAKEREGLYFLETRSGNGDRSPLSHLLATSSPNKDQIWLHHFHF